MIDRLYIAWKQGISHKRFIIAKLDRYTKGIKFEYLSGLKEARKQGLDHFYGISDDKKLNPVEVENMLSLRIISKERPDRKEYLKFWEADGIDDTFDLLGFTQGMSPTDNFEFLAEFKPQNNEKFAFVSDLDDVTFFKTKAGFLKKGDILTYKTEHFFNYRVAVFKEGKKIGYIKQIHNKIFNLRIPLTLSVKAVSENEFIKEIFIKIEKK